MFAGRRCSLTPLHHYIHFTPIINPIINPISGGRRGTVAALHHKRDLTRQATRYPQLARKTTASHYNSYEALAKEPVPSIRWVIGGPSWLIAGRAWVTVRVYESLYAPMCHCTRLWDTVRRRVYVYESLYACMRRCTYMSHSRVLFKKWTYMSSEDSVLSSRVLY